MIKPLVSIIMPAYNAERFLGVCIESILKQTFSNFELLIYNDASTDNTESLIHSFKDSRIKYYTHTKNKGYIYCLNYLLKEAKGNYIARMDADDICLANRLEKQVSYLLNNSAIHLISCTAKQINEHGIVISERTVAPQTEGSMLATLYFANLFTHPGVMFKRLLVDNGDYVYDKAFHPCEDYRLWTSLIIKGYKLEVLPEILIEYRVYNTQTSALNKDKKRHNSAIAKADYFLSLNPEIDINKELLIKFYEDKKINRHELMDVFKAMDLVIQKSIDHTFKITLAKYLHNYVNMHFKKNKEVVSIFKKLQAYVLYPYSLKEKIKFQVFRFI